MTTSTPGKHLLQMTAAVAAVIALMILATLLIDPYRVFGITNWNQKNFMPNSRYLQIEALKTRSAEAYVIGTSRVNYYTVKDFQELTGLTCYNLTMPNGTPDENLLELQWLLARQKPKMVLMGLDYDIQFLNTPLTESYLQKWMHPETTGTPLWRFRLEYLRFDVESTWLAIKRNFFERKVTYRFDVETGHYSLPKRDDDIRDNWAAYEAAQFQGQPPEKRRAHREHDDAVRQIVALLKKHGVEARFVFTPMHRLTLATFDRPDYEAWKARMREICGTIADFSEDPAIMNENRLFYEPVHFRAEAGRMVLEKLFAKEPKAP